MITGEFIEPKLEQEFFSYMLEETIEHFSRNLLIISLLFLLFIIPDYFLIAEKTRFNDYWLMGLPLQVFIIIIAIPLIMLFWNP